MLRMSRMMVPGTNAPDFSLPDTRGTLRTLADVRGETGLVVAFICNHCPFVLHLIDHFAARARTWAEAGVATVAISSNDIAEFPEDAESFMPAFVCAHGLDFPYLHDASQKTALAFEAICTPDFFLFDRDLKLFYAGQYDPSRPKIDRPPMPGLPPLRTDLPVTGADLQGAVDALLAGKDPPRDQRPSAGCSIKWKPDMEPAWA